jgi:hypothetical protein
MNSAPEGPKGLRELYYDTAPVRMAKAEGAVEHLTAWDFEKGAEDWQGIPLLAEQELMHRLHDRLQLPQDDQGYLLAKQYASTVLQASLVYHRFISSTMTRERAEVQWNALAEQLGEPLLFSLIRHADSMMLRLKEERLSGRMTYEDLLEWRTETYRDVRLLFALDKPAE